ncbi:SAF domain-containing protein [Mariniluteicoccus endophyticus]
MKTVEAVRPDTTGDTSQPFGAPPAPAVRPRRQPRWIATGMLAICLGGLGASMLYVEATGAHDVLQVTRPIPRGDLIRPGDLRPVSVGSLPGSATVPADQLGQLEGRRALIDLAGGAILPADAIGQPPVDRGQTQIGLRLAPGRLPVGDLPPGSAVHLIAVEDPRLVQAGQTTQSGGQNGGPSGQSTNPARPASLGAVVVSAPRPGPDGVAMLLDVKVPADRARHVAELAAAERIVLVKEG